MTGDYPIPGKNSSPTAAFESPVDQHAPHVQRCSALDRICNWLAVNNCRIEPSRVSICVWKCFWKCVWSLVRIESGTKLW